ncbi:MT-A70 family methyltransferase [Oscillospiraceae bacterium 21-37]
MKEYSIILADPPWAYKVWSKKGMGRSAENHYPTMHIEDIRALPVGRLAAKNCALFLWVTMPTLPEALSVIKAWGFTYKTVAFVWIKQNRKSPSLFWGLGHWTRANVWILAECPGDAGAVLLDTPEKMLDQLFNEVINDVVNADENKTHIPNALTLSEWEESEVRRRIAALLEPLTEDKNCYLQFMDRYLKAYQKNNGYIGEPDEL